jgi:hypothetical protein
MLARSLGYYYGREWPLGKTKRETPQFWSSGRGKGIEEYYSRSFFSGYSLFVALCIFGGQLEKRKDGNYGGRVEILEGIKKVLLDMESGKIQASALDTGFFRNYLFQPGVPDVDFMIRTSGEERISDFLLWQSAYAELYFTQTLWPDFDAEELYKALQVYQARERRYGGAQS